jgi:hypothetical protein
MLKPDGAKLSCLELGVPGGRWDCGLFSPHTPLALMKCTGDRHA